MFTGQRFTGEYRHQIDDKGRLAVPSRMRVLLEGPVIVARWLDSCLAIVPRSEWEAIEVRIGAQSLTDPAARTLERRLYGGAIETELDRQGRLLLPQNLRDFADLRDEVVVVGSRSHAEIWAPDRWDAERARLEDDAAFAAAISGLRV